MIVSLDKLALELIQDPELIANLDRVVIIKYNPNCDLFIEYVSELRAD